MTATGRLKIVFGTDERTALTESVRRAYRQRLFISTQGSFSARLDADSFLIPPYRPVYVQVTLPSSVDSAPVTLLSPVVAGALPAQEPQPGP